MSATISALVARIDAGTKLYQSWLTENGLTAPSFEESFATRYDTKAAPPPVATALKDSIEASAELHNLLVGPLEFVMEAGLRSNRLLALAFIYKNQLHLRVPKTGSKSFKELAVDTGLDVEDLRRMLRLAMTENLFREDDNELVFHSAASRTLVELPGLNAWLGLTVEENWPALQKLPGAMERYPGSQEPLESAYCMAHGMKELPFTVWRRDVPRVQRFGEAMAFLNENGGFKPDSFISTYDCSKLEGGTFVDIGGSHGHVSIQLARQLPSVKFIVQDLPETVEQGQAALPMDIAGRVTFMAHDYWEPNPIKGAEVYFFRWIFHDWSDLYCVKLLRALIPALRNGSRILINDALMPPIGALTPFQERLPRTLDMLMKSFSNAKERDANEWKILFETADPRFKLLRIWMPDESKAALIEAEWVAEQI